jgi:phosphomannomutase/phosphoglucomutase
VKCSQSLYDDIRKRGGNAIMWRTGHSLIKAKMKESHAELAGEMSGHMFFADRYYGFDDALYAACRLMEIVAQSGQPLSAQLADLPPTFTTPEIRVECADDIKFEVVRRVTERFRADSLHPRRGRRARAIPRRLGTGARLEHAAGFGAAL